MKIFKTESEYNRLINDLKETDKTDEIKSMDKLINLQHKEINKMLKKMKGLVDHRKYLEEKLDIEQKT